MSVSQNGDILNGSNGPGDGQQGSIAKNWGDGLTTDKQIISDTGISDPNSFFTALVGKPYISQVVIAPHIYGPSVSNDKSGASTGAALWARLSTSFGYLNKAVSVTVRTS